MKQKQSVTKESRGVGVIEAEPAIPSNAVEVAGILEAAAARLTVYRTEPLGTVVPPPREEEKRRHAANIACAFGGSFLAAVEWLRYHGHAETADSVRESYTELLKWAMEVDMALNGRASAERDRSPECAHLRFAAGVGANQLRRIACVIRQAASQDPGTGQDNGDGMPKTARYLFKNEGATWRIVYGTRETTVRDFKGMRYIHYLIENAGTLIESRDIERACSSEEPPESGHRADDERAMDADLHVGRYDLKLLDRWDARDIVKARDNLEDQIEDTDDPSRISELREQIRHLDDYLRKNLDKHGRERSVDDRERARWRVKSAIKTAQKAIGESDELIVRHFDAVRAKGTAFIYESEPPVPWVLR